MTAQLHTCHDTPPPLRAVGEGWGGVKQAHDKFKSCCKLEQPHPALPYFAGEGAICRATET